jgi:hypothetical protein
MTNNNDRRNEKCITKCGMHNIKMLKYNNISDSSWFTKSKNGILKPNGLGIFYASCMKPPYKNHLKII